MSDWRLNSDKYEAEPITPLAGMFEGRIHELVAARLPDLIAAYGNWEAIVNDHTLALFSRDDAVAIDEEVRATGYRYRWSAQISKTDFPDSYE